MTCRAMNPFLWKIFILLSLLQYKHIDVRHRPRSLLSLCLKDLRYDLLEAPIKDSPVSSKLVCGQWNIRLYLSSCPLLSSVTRWGPVLLAASPWRVSVCLRRQLRPLDQSEAGSGAGQPIRGRRLGECEGWGGTGRGWHRGDGHTGPLSLVCQSHGWDTEARWTPGRILCGDPSALDAATTGSSPGWRVTRGAASTGTASAPSATSSRRGRGSWQPRYRSCNVSQSRMFNHPSLFFRLLSRGSRRLRTRWHWTCGAWPRGRRCSPCPRAPSSASPAPGSGHPRQTRRGGSRVRHCQ